MPEKTYSEAEISALLGRAAQLQATNEPSGQSGLTLAEIKTIAEEAGIDQRFVDLASTLSSDHEESSWGIPISVGKTVQVSGKLTDSSWSQMVSLFSLEFGGPGETEIGQGFRLWKRGNTLIKVEEMGDKISFHAETRWEKELELPIASSIVGGVAAAMVGMMALAGLEWTLGIVSVLIASIVFASFSVFRKGKTRKKESNRQKFETTIHRCIDFLQDESSLSVIPDDTEAFLSIEEEDSSKEGISRNRDRNRV